MGSGHANRAEAICDRRQQPGTLPDFDTGLTSGDDLRISIRDGRRCHDQIGFDHDIGPVPYPGVGTCSLERGQHRARLEIGTRDVMATLNEQLGQARHSRSSGSDHMDASVRHQIRHWPPRSGDRQ